MRPIEGSDLISLDGKGGKRCRKRSGHSNFGILDGGLPDGTAKDN